MTPVLQVRLVDDDADLLAAQCQSLRIAGFVPEPFQDPRAALAGITPDFPGVILTDVRMPFMDGLELHEKLRAIDPELPVILLTGHGDVDMAVKAMRNGAWDFLTKPVGAEPLANALRRACHARALVLENRDLRKMARTHDATGRLLGMSPVMVHLRESADRLAEAGADVLISGPTGAGKEALARAIHASGPRKSRAFVHVACDAIDPARFEEDYIGTEAGSGAASRQARRVGRLEKAHRGTLFLDNVDLLPLPLQSRLLHLIETRELWVQGAAAARPFEPQILASTKGDLGALVASGQFRADLYYRLSAINVRVPPLVDRQQDIPLLFRHFLLAACRRLDQPVPAISAAVQAHLQSYDWPGNLRELDHYATSLALGVSRPLDSPPEKADLATLMARYEASILRATLEETGGNASRAMAALGLSRKTFYDRLQRHDLRAADFRNPTGGS